MIHISTFTTPDCLPASHASWIPSRCPFWVYFELWGSRAQPVPCQAPPAHLSSMQEGQWFQTPIPCRQSQFRTGYSHALVCPEFLRADTYGFKKHGLSRLLSSLPLVADKMPNALPGNTVSWCLGEMLCTFPPASPQGCCSNVSGIRVRMGQWGSSGFASPPHEPPKPCTMARLPSGHPIQSSPPLQAGARMRNNVWKTRWRACIFLPALQEFSACINRDMGDASRADRDCK